MTQALRQQSQRDRQFVEQLIALSAKQETERVLQQRRESINPSVLRMLRDKVSHWVRVDVPQAMKLAEVMRQAARLTDDPVCEALADHALAQTLDMSGRYAEAIQFYERAKAKYARLGQRVEAARITRAEIGALMCLGRYEEALQVVAQARQVFQQCHRPLLLAQLESNVGSIYHRLDRYQEALIFYQRAREIFEAHQDEMGLAHVSFNAANQYTSLNEFERALSLYRQAQKIYEKLNMPLLINQTEYSMAWLYFQRGKFQQSLKLFAKVRERSRELEDQVQEALCDLDLAEVYLQLNAYEDTIESAQSAVECFGALGMNYETAKARMYLGIARTHLSDFAAAEGELQQARHGFLAEGNDIFSALTDIYLSDVLTHRQDWHRALQLCAEARQIFSQHRLSVKAAYAELQLARLKLWGGQVAEAQQLCQSTLAAIGEMEAPWVKYQCCHLLGNARERAGAVNEAYECYRQAVEHLEGLRSSIRADEFKCMFLRDKLRVYEDLVELCLRVGTEEKIEEALSFAEAAKSRALVDLLAANQHIRGKAPGAAADALHREWRELREQLDWYYNRINRYELRIQQRPGCLAQLHREARQREQQLVKLNRRMRLEDAEYTSLQSASRPDVAELRRCLAENEILVEYCVVHDQVKVFVVSPDSVRLFNSAITVGATAPLLRTLRFNFSKFILGKDYVSRHKDQLQMFTDQCLHQLYVGLVEPMAPLLEGKKVIFVPHDVLHYVPFHALYDGRRYLIDRHDISYCPSASVYKLCWEKAQTPRASGRMLIMGVPDDATPFIHDEVVAVKSLWPDARVLLGAEATLDYLQRHATEFRLLHLASHGVFRRDNPLFSALKLGNSWLSFYDIFNLKLNTELVTLSACETGMNEVSPGDELFGLMRGFLYAGAPSLILSLWMVNDRSTAALMRWLYVGLKAGLSKRAALRQAQLRVKQEYRHPYYWAPFILMGAPS